MARRARSSSAPRPDICSFASARLRDAAAELRTHRDGALAGDVGSVHRARIALRRLRSDLRAPGVFDAAGRRAVDTAARDLGRALGRVRDLDVLTAGLEHLAVGASLEDAVSVGAVLERVRAERAAAAARVRDPEVERGYDTIVDELEHLAAAPCLHPGLDPAAPAHRVLRRAVRRSLHRDQRHARVLGAHPAPADLHALRRAVKRTRYCSDALHSLTGRARHARLTAALARVQDDLGVAHDEVVRDEWLRRVAADDVTLAYGAGVLVGLDARRTSRGDRWSRTRRALRRLDPPGRA